jgi:hypothetical protein
MGFQGAEQSAPFLLSPWRRAAAAGSWVRRGQKQDTENTEEKQGEQGEREV